MIDLTPSECLWYAVLYAYVGFGAGYLLRRVVDSLRSKDLRTDPK